MRIWHGVRMDLKTFTDLTSKMVAYRTTLASVAEAIPGAIRYEWYDFSTRTRCEHGAQGIEAGTDSTRTNALPFAVQFLAGVVPVDFLFEDTRETAKDAYRALCAEIGDPSKAAEQMAEYEQTYTPIHAGDERNKAEWLALAEQAGLPVPTIPTEVFASLTRAEFDAAVIVVDEYRNTMAAFTSAVTPEVVEEWQAFRTDVQATSGRGTAVQVDTRVRDEDWFRVDRAKAGHSLITTVPLGFLVEETREQFKDAYRSQYALAAKMKRDEEEHLRLKAEADRKEQARRDFIDLGQRLGYMDNKGTLTI
jgi:hypothetical protein